MKRYVITLTLIIVLLQVVTAQKIALNGTIFSFKGEKVMLLKKAQKNVSFDGSLSGVRIEVKGENGSQSITTGLSGFFSIKIDETGTYQVTVSKSGYSTLNFTLEYADAGSRLHYESLFLILKQDDDTKAHMGKIRISDGGVLSYDRTHADNVKSDLFESNAHLIEKTVLINKSGGGPVTNTTEIKKTEPEKKQTENKVVVVYDTTGKSSSKNQTDPLFLIQKITSGNIDSLQMNLDAARELLEKLTPGSGEYLLLKKQIQAAEQKIKDHQKIIALQEKEIAQANRILVFMILFLIVTLAAAGMLFVFFKQKKRHAALLLEKNKNIQRINTRLLSSIQYASLIQTSFLKEKALLKNIFKSSFIYNQPKDVLSGDFYWFAHINGHRILVVADCTGHGVPGALLTVLGHTMLEDIINVKGETVPSKILKSLNSALQHTFSSSNQQIAYGMDITIISMKENSNELLLSGVGNGLYALQNGKLNFFSVSPKTLGPDVTEADLTDQKINYSKNDTLFLFTDGFADQFGNHAGKMEKFNIKRFENLLHGIAGLAEFEKGEEKAAQQFTAWKSDYDQTDDVCLVGIKC